MRTRRTTLLLLALLTTLSTGLVAGCSSSGSGGSASSGSAGSADSAGSPASGGSDDAAAGSVPDLAKVPAAGSSSSSTPSTNVAKALTRQVRTAQLVIRVGGQDNALTMADTTVRSDATVFGGYVSDENTTVGARSLPQPVDSAEPPTPPSDSAESVITLRVPESRLDDALSTVSRVGQVLSRTTSAQDVTGSLADLTSRQASERASVDRLRTLMARATSLHDVVLLEGELTDRESDLESVEAQQRALAGQADLATLTVTLRATVPAVARPVHRTGFVGGLRNGWTGLAATVRVLLVVLGAVLPFGVVLAVLAWPGYLVTRRILRHRRTATTAPAAPAP